MAVEILAAQDLDDDEEEEEDLDKSRQADEKEDLQAGKPRRWSAQRTRRTWVDGFWAHPSMSMHESIHEYMNT